MVANCPLCGYRFNSDNVKSHCAACPVNSDCGKICCPNCDYSWVESSSIVDSLLSLFRKGQKRGRP